MAERFCLSERTSPSSKSNSSQPIHMSAMSGGRWGGGLGRTQLQQQIRGLPRPLPGVTGRVEFHREGEAARVWVGSADVDGGDDVARIRIRPTQIGGLERQRREAAILECPADSVQRGGVVGRGVL